MALSRLIAALLLFALSALARIDLSNGTTLEGSVSCLDCSRRYDFSGIRVLVKCDKVEKLAMATTESDGSFKADLPSSSLPSHCLAKLLGGPKQLYASRKDMISKIVKSQQAHEPSSTYTISTPLSFSISCPSKTKCGSPDAGTGAAKTIDLPIPPEWGLAPTSYYVPVPFFPIIGVP